MDGCLYLLINVFDCLANTVGRWEAVLTLSSGRVETPGGWRGFTGMAAPCFLVIKAVGVVEMLKIYIFTEDGNELELETNVSK